LAENSRVSLFVAPDVEQIRACAAAGAAVVELHTGSWCEAVIARDDGAGRAEFQKLAAAARLAASLGLEVHAGHGLHFDTAEAISALPEIAELNIGHYLVGEAVFSGFDTVIKNMLDAMALGRAKMRRAS